MLKEELLDILNRVEERITNKKSIIGFDGFIDYIVKPIYRRDDEVTNYFSDLATFSQYIQGVNNMSNAIELEQARVKLGGNNPILCNALCNLGVDVNSIGAYGDGNVNNAFSELNKVCKIYPIAEPGICFAYEFSSNKLMTYININKDALTYENIVNRVGKEALIEMFNETNIISLVNYGEIPWVINIWEMILLEIMPYIKGKKSLYFDLSDCSRLSSVEIEKVINIMREYEKFGNIYLGLNDNEFIKLYSTMFKNENTQQFREYLSDSKEYYNYIQEYTSKLQSGMGIHCVILRTFNKIFGCSKNEKVITDNIISKIPKLLTGAGDNQNAGICVGILSELSLEETLKLGALTGNYYISNGYSGTMAQLKDYVNNIL